MRLVILLSFALVLTMAAFAQTSSPPNSATAGVLGTAIPAPAAMGVIGVSGGFGVALPGSAVTGVPYSAEQVTEHVQTLADFDTLNWPTSIL